MAKDKERSVNPAQQQRKLEKAKALKKSKGELQAKRNEKLARRNPDRLQRQIDDLKALEASGDIKAREKAILEELERDLKAVRKARETLGEKAPHYGNRQPPRRDDGDNANNSVLGKRRHDGERKPFHSRRDSSGSDTDDSVRRIPMPEDTPPPIPREHRRYFQKENKDKQPTQPVPVVETQTTYSAAPQIRDLKKEAISKFVPNIVRRKQEAARGTAGGLVEPEEMDRLEAEGYLRTNQNTSTSTTTETATGPDTDEARRLAEEEARFQRELATEDVQTESIPHQRLRNVQIEEVEDEDA
jgi:hypothetical protein